MQRANLRGIFTLPILPHSTKDVSDFSKIADTEKYKTQLIVRLECVSALYTGDKHIINFFNPDNMKMRRQVPISTSNKSYNGQM